MAYRQTSRAKAVKERCRKAGVASQRKQAQDRLENGEPRSLWQPPEVRRVITITDYDFGEVTHTMELRKSGRIDCYDCYINGEIWKRKIGWSRALEWTRKAFVRVSSI